MNVQDTLVTPHLRSGCVTICFLIKSIDQEGVKQRLARLAIAKPPSTEHKYHNNSVTNIPCSITHLSEVNR